MPVIIIDMSTNPDSTCHTARNKRLITTKAPNGNRGDDRESYQGYEDDHKLNTGEGLYGVTHGRVLFP
jgi:hypothetical protein